MFAGTSQAGMDLPTAKKASGAAGPVQGEAKAPAEAEAPSAATTPAEAKAPPAATTPAQAPAEGADSAAAIILNLVIEQEAQDARAQEVQQANARALVRRTHDEHFFLDKVRTST